MTQRGKGILTNRQTAIMELLVSGDSNVQIAQKLHISDSTLKNHLQTISQKLGHVHYNRVLLVVWWVSFREMVQTADLQSAAEEYAAGVLCYRTTTPAAHHNTVKQAFLKGARYASGRNNG